MTALDSILEHEGFRSTPYPDPIHGWDKPTFGHGLTYITRQESKVIVQNRIKTTQTELNQRWSFFLMQEQPVRDILIEMGFQLGVDGVLKFKKMLIALQQGDFKSASIEMLDSLWAKQTPERAEELAKRMANLA